MDQKSFVETQSIGIHDIPMGSIVVDFIGCILLGIFWLFLFQFRNNRIHGILISKRTLIHSENGILIAEPENYMYYVFQPEARRLTQATALDFQPKISQKNMYSVHSE